METNPALAEPPAKSPAPPGMMRRCEIAAWAIVGLGLIFVLMRHLLPALLAGLFVYSMVHRIAVKLTLYKILHKNAKLAAMIILSVVTLGVSTAIVFAVIGLLRGRVGDVNDIVQQMLKVVEGKREWFTARGIGEHFPDADKMHGWAFARLNEFYEEIKGLRHGTMLMVIHALIGIVIGTLLSFAKVAAKGPLSMAFFERVRKFTNAFEAVIFAQVKISALNTLFTALYLCVALPAFGVELPFRATLIGVTFVCGLLPVAGNLISNTAIALISLGVSPSVAIASLGYLIVIHKFEYFLNAKIVGGHIDAAAWELLLAMLTMEAAFGVQGVILAPIAYAYLKSELKAKQLI